MVKPLRCAIDTLEATFQGELSEELAKELQNKKLMAQATESPQPILLGDQEYFVGPKGQGLWPWVASNSNAMLRFGNAKHLPPLSVKLRAEGLASKGAEALWNQVRTMAGLLGLSPRNCTRLDVAVDFQGWAPTLDEMRHAVCPASYRPIFPNLEHPETFQFGKGDVVVRVYDKTEEIKANSHEWWKLVWRACEGYDPALPVWRVEVQLRSAALREVGCSDVFEAIANQHGVFEFGLDWCSIKEPTADTNPSRWPDHPAWAYLRRYYMPGQPLGRVKPAKTLADYDRAVKRYLTLVVSVGASVGSQDYWRMTEILSTDAEIRIERELDTTFAELVEKKRRQQSA